MAAALSSRRAESTALAGACCCPDALPSPAVAYALLSLRADPCADALPSEMACCVDA